MAQQILVVEDENLIRQTLIRKLTKEGFEVTGAADGHQARDQINSQRWDLIMLDITLPGPNGLTLLREIKQEDADVPVIMLTGNHQVEYVVEAMKAGAFQYLTKPFQLEEVVIVVRKALEIFALHRKVNQIQAHESKAFGFDSIIGQSQRMQEIRDIAQRVAASQAETILLLGESGTGKNLLAQAIHHHSPRANRPFTEITCTAISETLLESELFGHEKGAFTDARQSKQGLAELANGGTLFLDEIGDMPLTIQAKLLGFLESRKFRRVGGTRDIHVDLRIIAATNVDLAERVEEKRFRADLYFRLNVIELRLPALREHPADIELLAKFFVHHFNRKFRKNIRGIDPDATQLLETYPWPGNARELRNQIERAMILNRGDILRAADLSLRNVPPNACEQEGFQLPSCGLNLEELENSLVQQAMERADQNQTHAAKLLSISRDQLRYRLKKLHIPKPNL